MEVHEQDHEKALTRMIRFAELYRVKFMLRSYLRKRLKKIEAFAIHIYINPALSSRLAPYELEYAKEYIDAVNKLCTDSILSRMPKDYDSLIHQSEAMESEVPDMIPSPSLDQHVFMVAKTETDLPVGNTSVQLQEGDIYAIRYSSVNRLLLEDRGVCLL